jgi:hypothetical protein
MPTSRKRRGDRFGQPRQAVTTANQNVAQPTIAQLESTPTARTSPLGLGDPYPKACLRPSTSIPMTRCHRHRHRTLIPDLNAETINITIGYTSSTGRLRHNSISSATTSVTFEINSRDALTP